MKAAYFDTMPYKEVYDNWRYHYPDFEKSQLWEKVPPQWLTDLFVNSSENK